MKRYNGPFVCFDCKYYGGGFCMLYKIQKEKSSKDAEYCDAFEKDEEVPNRKTFGPPSGGRR